MATVIKSSKSQAPFEPALFSFEDAAAQANSARCDAEAILMEAHCEAERIRQTAQQAGRTEGLQDAEQLIQQKTDQQMAIAMPILREAAAALEKARIAWRERWEQSAVELAIKIAEKITRQQIARTSSVTLGLVREALEMCAGAPQFKIHLHPADFSSLETQVNQIVHELSRAAQTTVVPDESVSRGGCVIETPHGAIDQRIETRLARIATELVGNES